MDTSNEWPSLAATKLSQFKSTKTPHPILYRRRWHREALIQLTLRPEVKSFKQLEIDQRCSCCICLSIKLESGSANIGLSEHEQLTSDCPEFNSIPRSHILAEPRRSNAIEIWKQRNHPVPVAMRLSILRAFEANRNGLQLKQISLLYKEADEVIKCILRMICDGQIAMPLEDPITGETSLKLLA